VPVWAEQFLRTPEAAGWKVQAGGFHLASEYSARAGGRLLNWLEGDLTGASKRLSKPFVIPQGTTISISWRYIFKLDALTGNDGILVHLFGNEEAINNASATYDAYALEVVGNNGLNLLRLNGGGASVAVHAVGWAAELNEHEIIVTREVSGANRFWRTYLDGVLIGGPTNDATYTAANWMGFEHGPLNRQRTASFVMQW